jgi:hypothetical protein
MPPSILFALSRRQRWPLVLCGEERTLAGVARIHAPGWLPPFDLVGRTRS